jgi:hypothetical protein
LALRCRLPIYGCAISSYKSRHVSLGDHVCDADVQGAARAAGENVNIELLHALSFAIGMAGTSPAITPVGV